MHSVLENSQGPFVNETKVVVTDGVLADRVGRKRVSPIGTFRSLFASMINRSGRTHASIYFKFRAWRNNTGWFTKEYAHPHITPKNTAVRTHIITLHQKNMIHFEVS